MEYSQIEGFEHVPLGFQKGRKLIWFLVFWISIILVAPLLILRRHHLIDQNGHLNEISDLRKRGFKVAMLFDHYSMMDIPVPLALYWWSGHRDLVKNIFFLIGVRWSKRLLCKGSDHAWVVPPTVMPEAENMDALRPYAKCNAAAKQAAKRALEDGLMLWLAPQGTRSRLGVLEKAPEGARRFWQEADYVVPISLEGTQRMVPIGLKFYQFWRIRPLAEVSVIVGKPIHRSEAPTARTVVYEQARLHYLLGDRTMAGVYLEDLRREYEGIESIREEITV